ncbi:MAG TPA: amidohydrolase family protein [Paenalcaligenes sp.]|nr:amidohydrolase family protein [Paenalcaligenes sp.]
MFTPDPLDSVYQPQSTPIQEEHEQCKCSDEPARKIHAQVMMAMADNAGQLRLQESLTAFKRQSRFGLSPQHSDKPFVLTNMWLFDGEQTRLQTGLSLRIEGNRITAVENSGVDQGDAHIIDCQNHVVMPGLIDAHWHTTLCAITEMQAMAADVALIHLIAAKEAENTLLRGFTTVRDAGGPSFALKKAIDDHILHGPRIFPSGAMISQTSGHGDFRMRYEIPSTPDQLGHSERAGVTSLANGQAQVLQRVREQLLLGATQIKLMVGGGVTSLYDPIDSVQFTADELRAGVQAAKDWGTYAMVHVYTAQGIKRAIENGVASIEHGQLADEETARLMRDEGVWWSLQPFLGDEDANQHNDPNTQRKQQRVAQGTVNAYELAQRFDIKTAWGTDILFTPQNLPRQGHMLAKMTQFYDPLTALKIATGDNGKLLALAGNRYPYPAPVGVLKANAMADILIVEGTPDRNLDFLTRPDDSLRAIIKDGLVYKWTL